jgi:hypothetical protein
MPTVPRNRILIKPQSRVPHLRDGLIVAKVGSQDLQG